MSTSLVALLHVCDSLFPIGAFSHSDGLEAATSDGRVQSADDLELWMRAVLHETLRTLEGPAVTRAWRLCVNAVSDDLRRLDAEVYALRPASAGRAATRAMGSRLLRTWQDIRPHPVVAALASDTGGYTLPVAFGAVARSAGVPVLDAIEGFAYTRLAATVSAAMRLMPLGQREAHRLLATSVDAVPQLARDILEDDVPVGSFAPAMDIAAMSQQYVHSRLFRS